MRTEAHAAALLVLSLSWSCANAQTSQATTAIAGAAPLAGPPGPPRTVQDVTHPVSWLTWGGDFRVRHEYFNNILTLSPQNPLREQDYFRYRARLWASVTPVENISLNARLATEPREWMRPAGYTPYKGNSGLDMTEGVVDTLNVRVRNLFGQPATLTVGRQDITLGEGWLTGDGSPLDGSWTYFLDAARLSYNLKDQHTLIEVIGIVQNAKDDAWLQTINDQDRFLTEQNEKGAILNVVNTNFSLANLNGYFIYKGDDKAGGFNAHNVPTRGGDNADIYTLGGRLSGLIGKNWKYSAEGAYQWGRKQDADISDAAVAANPAARNDYRRIDAFGFNSKAIYLFNDKFNNQVSLSYEFLSGDSSKTHKDEMFDVLWGRYPRWSEIGAYSYAAETRFGQEANLHRFGPTWALNPIKSMEFSVSYYALFAPEQAPTRQASATLFTGSGNFRGHFAQALVKYKFNQHMSGHLWSEILLPGDYYASRTSMCFLRAELMFSL